MTVAEPIPPPAHIAATPIPPPRRRVDLVEVDVGGGQPGPAQRLGYRPDRRQPGLRGVDADRRPRPDHGQRRQPEPVTGDHQGGRAVVGAAGVARGDAEPLNLRVQRLERGQLLQARVVPRVLVHCERAVRRLDRDDLGVEAALVDRANGVAV
jgi:hypothetical protein